ncbi:NAD(P)-binding protein [Venustampulla echinocandica]|uniref:NAD(P)-binding protein n=1 Tax=Venustampulla echinocandica TaxID=2656787 RepID=A0A370TGI9_9HELO|nr:NAD(P)-binding protein [Venustampulla echinocandica]RDL34316.1 NAD(P)-binding protein [Venustampulla echinocandica]
MENLPVDYFLALHAFTKVTHRDIYPEIDPASPSNSQAGKVIVITGASKGLGRLAFATSFAKANPKGIVLAARSAIALVEVVQEIHAINSEIEVLAIPTDILKQEDITALWRMVKERFGHADVLVNNAGAFSSQGPLGQVEPGAWWTDFEINARGSFLMTRGFLALLNHSQKGTIINLTTGAATEIVPSLSSYSLSKLIALQMQGFIAAENPNVTAVALHPGMVMTDMSIKAGLERFALDTPSMVGGVAVWLCAGKAPWLSGRYLCANWCVEELKGREREVVEGGKLRMGLVGDFGAQQFK